MRQSFSRFFLFCFVERALFLYMLEECNSICEASCFIAIQSSLLLWSKSCEMRNISLFCSKEACLLHAEMYRT